MLVFPLLRQAGTILFGSHTLITLSNALTLLVPLGQAVRVESAVNASKFESMSKTPTSQSLFAEQTNSARSRLNVKHKYMCIKEFEDKRNIQVGSFSLCSLLPQSLSYPGLILLQFSVARKRIKIDIEQAYIYHYENENKHNIIYDAYLPFSVSWSSWLSSVSSSLLWSFPSPHWAVHLPSLAHQHCGVGGGETFSGPMVLLYQQTRILSPMHVLTIKTYKYTN